MAKVKIVGRDWLNIPQSVAENILRWKADSGYSPDKVVDLGYLGAVELGQIKQVVPDDPDAVREEDEQEMKSAKRQQAENEHSAEVAMFRLQTPGQKAERVARTFAFILWATRGNWARERPKMPEELILKIAAKIVPYFIENPAEWSCSSKLYQELIPYGTAKVVRSSVAGVMTIGQAIQARG